MFLQTIFSSPLTGLAFLIGMLCALTVHEYAHGWAAVKAGDPTPKLAGRLSLNPLVHLDFLGTLFFFLAGFGWAKPVPINPFNLRHPQRDQALIALAGPLANVVLAFILALPLRLAYHHFIPPLPSFLETFLLFIIQLNLVLAVFNLLPIPPLDGSHILFAFLSPETQVAIEQIGPWVLFGLLFLAYFSPFNLFSTVLIPIVQFLSYLIIGFPGGLF